MKKSIVLIPLPSLIKKFVRSLCLSVSVCLSLFIKQANSIYQHKYSLHEVPPLIAGSVCVSHTRVKYPSSVHATFHRL